MRVEICFLGVAGEVVDRTPCEVWQNDSKTFKRWVESATSMCRKCPPGVSAKLYLVWEDEGETSSVQLRFLKGMTKHSLVTAMHVLYDTDLQRVTASIRKRYRERYAGAV